jgi:hypothetical protein
MAAAAVVALASTSAYAGSCTQTLQNYQAIEAAAKEALSHVEAGTPDWSAKMFVEQVLLAKGNDLVKKMLKQECRQQFKGILQVVVSIMGQSDKTDSIPTYRSTCDGLFDDYHAVRAAQEKSLAVQPTTVSGWVPINAISIALAKEMGGIIAEMVKEDCQEQFKPLLEDRVVLVDRALKNSAELGD